MKKIGICACYNSRNYGSMLQAYATQVVIENFGIDSEFIVYQKKKDISFLLKQMPRVFNKNLMFDKMMVLRKKLAINKHPDIKEKEKIREYAFLRFKEKYYRHFSKEFYGYDMLREGAKNYSSIVVGSDQLWTPGGLATNFYNLMFVPDDINKVSYATSFGVSEIPKYQYKRTKEFLTRIDHLSVRELKGAEIIKNLTGVNAKVVVDPTLLLTKEEWQQLIPEKIIEERPYIFCYFLGENSEHRVIANDLKTKTDLQIVTTPHLDSFVKGDIAFGDKQLFDIGPDDFMNLIRGARFILTDSFHGTVFSIIHKKKFITLNRFAEGTHSRNSRIDSLCDLLGLHQRRYKENIYSQIMEDIDYESVNVKLTELRNDSISYLSDSLV